jgi:hypothetical protein
MIFYMMLTVVMFTTFMFATIWFIFFNDVPAAWFESTYYINQGQEPTQLNTRILVASLGLFCGVVTFVLYVNLQLMKKLSRRMERINTFIQI